MPRTLDHLPAGKRAELAFVVEVLTAGFDEELLTRWAKHLKNGQILRIILYGSYARGDWLEEPVGRYFSDYDLLVVVADEKHADVLECWRRDAGDVQVHLASRSGLALDGLQ